MGKKKKKIQWHEGVTSGHAGQCSSCGMADNSTVEELMRGNLTFFANILILVKPILYIPTVLHR